MAPKGFRETLRRLRLAKGFTQGELAKRAGLHRVNVTQLETRTQDNPTLTTLLRLAKALRVPPSKLLEWRKETR